MPPPRRQLKRARNDGGSTRQTAVLVIVTALNVCLMLGDRSDGQSFNLFGLMNSSSETSTGLLLTEAERKALAIANQQIMDATKSDVPFQENNDTDYNIPVTATKYTLSSPSRTNETTVVIVLTHRNNFDRRAIIRDTWAKRHNNVYFVIGGPLDSNNEDKDLSNPLSTSSMLMKEQDLHGDMIDSIHPDTYKSLPYKLHYGMKWVVHNLHQVNWIVKADDDQVVRLNLLEFFVLRKFNPNHPSVLGGIIVNSKPHRKGKWAEDPSYAMEYYPPWAFGSAGYIASRQVAEYVGRNDNLHYYQGEDTGLGIWLAESSLQTTWIDTPEVNKDKICDDRFFIIGHGMSVNEIKNCYDQLGDSVPERKSIVSFGAGRKEMHPKKIIIKGNSD